MLENLVSGKENSRLILVHDTVKHRGNCILNYITQALLDRLDIVFLFLLEKHPGCLKFNNENRLFVHDGFTDPLKWTANKPLTYEPEISKPFYLKEVLIKTLETDIQFQPLISGKVAKVGIIVDSLSTIISHQNIAGVCKDLYEVIHYCTQTTEVVQTAALVHSDLHDENILSSLNYIASTRVELKMQGPKDNQECAGHFVTSHCKKGGKIHRKKEGYRIDSKYCVEIIPIEEKTTTEETSESVDITSDLTFNLTLTEQQKQARAQLQLPYLLDDKTKQTQLDLGKESKIFYQADEADDFDEEDPDDDLNI